MAGGEFLAETGGAGRLDDIHHVAAGGIEVVRIAAFEVASRRRAAAVVVHDHRILLRRIEVRREVVAAVDGLAAAVGVVPVVDLAQFDAFEKFRRRVLQQGAAALFQQPAAHGVGDALAHVGDLAGLRVEAGDHLLLHVQLLHLRRLGIELEQRLVIPVFGHEIDLAVVLGP